MKIIEILKSKLVLKVLYYIFFIQKIFNYHSRKIAIRHELQIDSSKLNVNSGAIALGHPIESNVARILVTLLYEIQKRKAETSLATLCISGGQGISMVVSR
ncbi:hypothetical protein GSQ54_04415 [Clostridioides difficile]|nr:hypothetical protein [Clostridioides difficile]